MDRDGRDGFEGYVRDLFYFSGTDEVLPEIALNDHLQNQYSSRDGGSSM